MNGACYGHRLSNVALQFNERFIEEQEKKYQLYVVLTSAFRVPRFHILVHVLQMRACGNLREMRYNQHNSLNRRGCVI